MILFIIIFFNFRNITNSFLISYESKSARKIIAIAIIFYSI